ncbi:MAG: restriction endonuclease subunit S [Gallionella sp.]|nr:restriction endonuclease subunit S [Gallionella sp.]
MTNLGRKLGEVCQILTGGTPSRTKLEYFGGGISWVKITDMLQGTVLLTDESLTEAGIKNSSAKLMPLGTVLISIFATIGRTAVLGIEAATNQAIAGVVPKDNAQLDSQYLKYFLDSQHGELNRLARGVAQPNINQRILKDLDVPLPSLVEQRRIVDILSRADGIVKLRREAEKKAAELIPALFLDMFGDPATNPKGWPVRLLQDLVSFMSGGTPSKSREDFWQGDLPWVSPKDMKQVYIVNAIDHVSRKVLAETNIKLVPIGSLLIVVRGMILVHTVPVAQSLVEHTINQDMKALFPVSEITVGYLLWLMKVSQQQLLGLVSTAAHGTKKLDTERLKDFRIPLPPLHIQIAFNEKVALIESIQSQQAAATATAQATFDALLSQAFAA